jgi:lipoprotein-anchoring transpeptidase ErfK/SrfK
MRTVRVTTQESDGAVYGIGIPIVVQFDPAPRDARAFEDDTTVTVDGRAAGGAWYWVEPTAAQKRQHELEAHYRPRAFWPAHSHVHVQFGFGGRSAGAGLVFAKGLTSLDFSIGAAHVSVIDAQRLRMTVTTDGRFDRRLAVSLGAAVTPTYEGIKIVMQKGEDAPGTSALRPDGTVLMSGPGYTDHPVPWSVRITRSGEYVHAASWNHAIGERSTSNGCTNLSPADAKWFYGFSRIGDVVRYPRTDGGPMPTWDGVRDWNVPWSQWLAGGPGRPGA